MVHEGKVVTVEGKIIHELKASVYLLETVTTLPSCTN